MPVITVHGGEGPPASYHFEQDVVTIGRSDDCDLVVHDRLLSRFHAELSRTKEGWQVLDRGSRNGTLLNGRRVQGDAKLQAGDRIALGSTTIVFDSKPADSFADGSEAETTPGHSTRGTGSGGGGRELVGRSAALTEQLAILDKVAPSQLPVLITGESGTGKELAARWIHRRSSRASHPFIAVNCPALTGSLAESELFGVEKGVATGVEARPGRLESAHGGTLFLDEIGDLDLATQAKLLRFLQEGSVDRLGGRQPVPVDVRVVAATNHDLEADIREGRFRRDLYHRLNGVNVTMPPLRERREDVALLVAHFLEDDDGSRPTMTAEALEALARHDFPGNVRELEHLVHRARVLADEGLITVGDLPDSVRTATSDSALSSPTIASLLWLRLTDGEESFWTAVQQPFLRRELSRDDVRALVDLALNECGDSYKAVAERWRIESQYKKFVNFLRNHELRRGSR